MKDKSPIDGLPRRSSMHLQEQILDSTLPGQFHAGEGDASPYKKREGAIERPSHSFLR